LNAIRGVQGRGSLGGNAVSAAAVNAAAAAAVADEHRLHREACANVRLKAQRLRHALSSDRLDDALAAAGDIAYELKASTAAAALSPKLYYDVYLAVTEELRLLQAYLLEFAASGASMLEIYERVQSIVFVVPRLYLLITVGSVYIKSGQVPVKELLSDLLEMCSAVQHSTRGLFLRAYLTHEMRDKLPKNIVAEDSVVIANQRASQSANRGGSLEDSIDFVLRNFVEMNRLWVRMQQDFVPMSSEVRSRERKELRLLVGTNISTLARMESLDIELYSESVLPQLCEQIIACGDATAQEYLADCIVQVFPDEFQMKTLDQFLAMCSKLSPGINMRSIIAALTDRLARFASESPENAALASGSMAFEIFRSHLPTIIAQSSANSRLSDMLAMYLSLLQFALKAHHDRLDYVDDIFAFCLDTLRLNSVPNSIRSAAADGSQNGSVHGVNSVHRSSSGTPGLVSDEHRKLEGSMSRSAAFKEYDDRSQSAPVLDGPLGNGSGADEFVTVSIHAHNSDTGTETARIELSEFSQEETIVVQILTAPIQAHASIPKILQLNHFLSLRTFLCLRTQQRVATALLQSQPKYEASIGSVPDLHKLFDFVGPLLEVDTDSASENDAYDVDEHQVYHPYLFPHDVTNHSLSAGTLTKHGSPLASYVEDGERLVSRAVYLLDPISAQHRFDMYRAMRSRLNVSSRFGWGTLTLPTLISAMFQLILRSNDESLQPDNNDSVDNDAMIQFLTELLVEFSPLHEEIAVQLFCQAAVCMASSTTYSNRRKLALEYFNHAILLFEQAQSLASSREQFSTLVNLIGCLERIQQLDGFDSETFEILSSRMVKYACRLLTRPEQILALCACSSLFWPSSECSVRDEEKVTSVVETAMSIADGCLSRGEQILGLIDVLVRCVYLVEKGCVRLKETGRIEQLVDSISERLERSTRKNSAVARVASSRFTRILNTMRRKADLFGVVPA